MVSGKTGEIVIVSGLYVCEKHPLVEQQLIEKDTFPHCSNSNHETTWKLKEEHDKEAAVKDPETNKEEPEVNAVKAEHNYLLYKSMDADIIYKKKGFFSALNNKKFPGSGEFELKALLEEEKGLTDEQIKQVKSATDNKLEILKKKFEDLKRIHEEKIEIKKEFEKELDKLRVEFDLIAKEINSYYVSLRKEVKALGESKEGLIQKRINEFEKEISRIIQIYQDIERKQNDKFKSDFDKRNLQDSEKKFYYDYRAKLENSFTDVQSRVQALEKEGLNYTIAKFLLAIGWISAFASSWFFELWYTGQRSSGSGLLVYIFDGLRSFVLQYPVWVSCLVFPGYVWVILLISKFCYKHSAKYKLLNKQGKKKNKHAEDDSVEFNFNKTGLLKTKLKANSWYDLWLKMAPFISMILFIIIILALGSEKSDGTYGKLSDSVYIQPIGLLFPISFTALIFLYITKVVEAKPIVTNPDTTDEKSGKTGFSWGFKISVALFLILVILLLAYQFNFSSLHTFKPAAWGFFTGCLCTGLSLAYGYRYISLNETFDLLVARIDFVNAYIEKAFYPFEASYLKNGEIIFRMRALYHTLLNLLESRNTLALKLLDPAINVQEKNADEKDATEKDKTKGDTSAEDTNKQAGSGKHSFKNILNYLFDPFLRQIRELKRKITAKDAKIKEQEEKIGNLKKDTIDINELIYFPEAAAKIKEYKFLIEERTKRYIEIKEELEGYFKNEKTYLALNNQLKEVVTEREELAGKIFSIEMNIISEKKKMNEELKIRKNLIEEGYILGTWYAVKYPSL
jgi:hypothetical protein